MGKVCLGNKILCNIEGVGDILIKTKDGCNLLLKRVRHVPYLEMNLIFTRKLDDEGFHIVFGNGSYKIVKGFTHYGKGEEKQCSLHIKTKCGEIGYCWCCKGKVYIRIMK